MISSFHAIIPSFHGIISSFHAVFGLRQRDKSAKVIDYNDQVIRVREYLLFRGIPSPMYFQLSRKRQCTASFPANVYNLSLKRLHPLPQTFATFASNVCGEKTPFCGIPSPHVFLLSRFPTVMLWVTLLSEVHLRWYSSVASALPIPQACCAMCAVDFPFHSSPCVV